MYSLLAMLLVASKGHFLYITKIIFFDPLPRTNTRTWSFGAYDMKPS